jgi:hypothetical protein
MGLDSGVVYYSNTGGIAAPIPQKCAKVVLPALFLISQTKEPTHTELQLVTQNEFFVCKGEIK